MDHVISLIIVDLSHYSEHEVKETEFLPMLSYILKHGNVTVYQWQNGRPPVRDQNQTSVPRNGNRVRPEEFSIDWRAGLEEASSVVTTQDDGIDFGEIDFSDSVLDLGGVEEGVALITLEESGVAAVQEGGVAVQEEGVAAQEGGEAVDHENREYNGNNIIVMHTFN